MHTREEKLAIGEELDTLFKPVVKTTERAASVNKKEMEELQGDLENQPILLSLDPRKLELERSETTRRLDYTGRKLGNYNWGVRY